MYIFTRKLSLHKKKKRVNVIFSSWFLVVFHSHSSSLDKHTKSDEMKHASLIIIFKKGTR